MPAMPYLAPNAALRYDVVGRLAIRLHPLDVLEIGCGQGGFGSRLAAGRRYLAVEPDPDSYAVARSRIEPVGGTVLNADHTGVPTGSTYDLVCAFEVLEHLDNDKAALADWVELVRPGGHLLLSVPAWPHRFGSWDTMVGHYRRYTPDALADLMRDVGLVGPETFLYGWPLGQVLELVRNRIAGRRFSALAGSSYEERTAGSGRVLQPARLSGLLATGGTMPFRYLQRLAPRQGTGLVALARRPAAS
ncbi:MAG: class I SAM-dependent methyltransferase [Actinobacteria bacterium]|nr:class I SAM-dependent methyltransferase [Actinomycetota bacterium]MBI3687856.1 class I SAM-dependent methyltransferase [Actinomycetota bacterium]